MTLSDESTIKGLLYCHLIVRTSSKYYSEEYSINFSVINPFELKSILCSQNINDWFFLSDFTIEPFPFPINGFYIMSCIDFVRINRAHLMGLNTHVILAAKNRLISYEITYP